MADWKKVLTESVINTNTNLGSSDVVVPSQNAVKTYVDAQVDSEDQISELNDVTISSISDEEVLQYDSTTSKWLNTPLSSTGDISFVSAPGTSIQANLNNGAVATTNLSDLCVTSGKISDNAISSSKISAGSVTHVKLGADAVDGDNIADGSIGNEHIGAAAVDTAELADSAVTSVKLASNSVGNTAMADDAIGQAELADDAVATAAIVNSAVTSDKIASNAVTSAKIAANTIVAGDIAANAIGSSELADDAVDTAAIEDLAVSTAKIADDAVTSAKIDAGAVDTTALGSMAVTSGKLGGSAVTTAKIANDAVTLAKLVDSSATKVVIGRMSAGGGTYEEVAIGVGGVQGYDATLQQISQVVSPSQYDMLMFNASSEIELTSATNVRTGLGLGSTSNPSFAGTTSGNVQVGLTNDNTIDTSSGDLDITATNITLTGNLSVTGNIVSSGATNLDVADKVITLGTRGDGTNLIANGGTAGHSALSFMGGMVAGTTNGYTTTNAYDKFKSGKLLWNHSGQTIDGGTSDNGSGNGSDRTAGMFITAFNNANTFASGNTDSVQTNVLASIKTGAIIIDSGSVDNYKTNLAATPPTGSIVFDGTDLYVYS